MNKFSHDQTAGWQCGQMTRCPCGRLVNVQCGHVSGCPGGHGAASLSGPSARYTGGQGGSWPNCHVAAGPRAQGESWTGAHLAGCPIDQKVHWSSGHVVACSENQRSSWSNTPEGNEIGLTCGQIVRCPCGQAIRPMDAPMLKCPNVQADNSGHLNRCPCGQLLSNLNNPIIRRQNSKSVSKEIGKHYYLPGTCNIIYGKSLVPVHCNGQSENENISSEEETDEDCEDVSEDDGICIKNKTLSSTSKRQSACMRSANQSHRESLHSTGCSKLVRLFPRKSFRGCQDSSGNGILLYCTPVDASGVFPSDCEHAQKRSNQKIDHTSKEELKIYNPSAISPADKNCHTIVYKTVYKTHGEDPFPGKIVISNNRKEPEMTSRYVEANTMDYHPLVEEPVRVNVAESVQTDFGRNSRMNALWSERPSVESDVYSWDRRNS